MLAVYIISLKLYLLNRDILYALGAIGYNLKGPAFVRDVWTLTKRFRYRIAVNNNFRGLYAYLDFKQFGIVTDFVAFSGTSSGPNEGESPQSIGIYLNYKCIGIVKSKAGARVLLEKLILEAPVEARKDFEDYKDKLFKVLRQ